MALTGKWVEGIGPDSLVVDAARRSLETRLSTMSQCLPLAAYLAEHDVEHVHRLRVATRRAAAALKLYRDFSPRRNTRWIKKRLRKMRRAAGEARDLDVLAERLQHEFPDHAAVVLPLVQSDRAAAQPAIVEAADARRHDRFVRKTKKLLDRIETPADEADSQAPARFQEWAPSQLAPIADAFMTALPGESSDMAALHQFRIRAKALRYAMELLSAGIKPPTLMEEQYPVIKELQDHLGGINDRVASADRFRRWASETNNDAQRQTLESLIADDAVRLADDVRSFQQWWTADRVERLQQLLAVPTAAINVPEPASENAPGA